MMPISLFLGFEHACNWLLPNYSGASVRAACGDLRRYLRLGGFPWYSFVPVASALLSRDQGLRA